LSTQLSSILKVQIDIVLFEVLINFRKEILF